MINVNRELVHISDDEKFVDNIYWQFEKLYPGQNTFYILVDNKEVDLKYTVKKDNIIIVERKHYKDLIGEFKRNMVVFLHNLEEYKAQIVIESPEEIIFVWMFFGVEYYSYLDKSNVYGKLSSRYKNQWLKTFLKRKVEILFLKYYTFINNKIHPRTLIRKASQKIKYFATISKEDYNLVRDEVNKEFKHFVYSYYPLEFIIKEINIEDIQNSNNSILVGNSSFLSNNHFEAFQILNQFDVEDRKVIVPLSYGDSDYRNEVIKRGSELFEEAFAPVLNFMPLADYNKMLSNCNIAIFNSYRQQAIGNIVALLWMGAKVYLDERNTFYQYLKRKKVIVFSINKDLNSQNKDALCPLKSFEIEENRMILRKNLSSEVLLKALRNQIETIYNNNL